MAGEVRESAANLATDAEGHPVADPTRNVLDLVEAAIQRQDDLREAESTHVREMLALRAVHWEQESEHVRLMAKVQAGHGKELREAEAARIDAIRAVDVAAVQQGRSEAETRATALAQQVSSSAEAMRAQVAAAATAAATSLAAALEPVQKDIADLRRAQYEAQGQKTQVVESRGALGGTTAIIASVATILFLILSATGIYLGTRDDTPPIIPPTVTVTVPEQSP